MTRTLVGIFDDATSAQSVIQELQGIGLPSNHSRMLHNGDGAARAGSDHGSWTEKVSNWFKSLGDDDDDQSHADHYAEAWRRGNYLVVADVDDAMVDPVVSIMNSHGAVDVERRSEHWKQSGYSGRFDASAQPYTAEQFEDERRTYGTGEAYDATDDRDAMRGARSDTMGSDAIPVVQEELAVGKRVVQRGGVRIHSYVEERPVEEVVQLRDERVDVQRHAVDRPADANDLAFKERTVEVTARGEEAVVDKRARVVEEVRVNKSVSAREQKVADTLRRKDVRVENLPPEGDAPISR